MSQFHFNLIFVSVLTTNCQLIKNFFPDYFVIPDISTRTMIGEGEKSDALYILSMSNVNATNLTNSLQPTSVLAFMNNVSACV